VIFILPSIGPDRSVSNQGSEILVRERPWRHLRYGARLTMTKTIGWNGKGTPD
jgi:hypothetical protein